MIKLIFLLFFLFVSTLISTDADIVNFHYNNSYKYGITYTIIVNKANEYILEFGGDGLTYDTPARVSLASVEASATYPVFITARQQKGVLSWQLPMTIQTSGTVEELSNVSRTLCPHNNLFNRGDSSCDATSLNTPIIHISTLSMESIPVAIRIEAVKDFYIKLNEEHSANMSQLNHTYSITISPSEPMYFFYSFDQSRNFSLDVLKLQNKFACGHNFTEHEERYANSMTKAMGSRDWLGRQDGVSEAVSDWPRVEGGWFWRPKSVILMAESDNDVCAVISIQNFSCPVFDNERDILYDGQYLTMTRAGGITLTEQQFPLGFYIVFIVKSWDEDCLEKRPSKANSTGLAAYLWESQVRAIGTNGRSKSFRFAVVATISYSEYATAAGLSLAFFLTFYAVFFVSLCCRRRKQGLDTTGRPPEEDVTAPSVPHGQSSTSVLVAEANPSIQDVRRRNSPSTTADGDYNDSDCDSDVSILADVDTDRKLYILPSRLCVASLSRVRAKVRLERSNLYLWSVLTVTVFYTLPVVQLVFTYQLLLHQSGNQDLCYYNFLCAHPLGFLSDFNHVYSNIGYALLGALFLLQVYVRQRREMRSTVEEKELGIPQHYGLLYAMGIALVSEGVLSASYHVCPNDMNFQFDTSFMYVTAVLCMVKIYQSRHPDINARAHATFGVLALIIFIGLVGVLNASVYFWAFFTIIHIATCFVLTFKIYYLGRFRYDAAMLCRAARELVRTPVVAVTPLYCSRMVLLMIVNVVNWALAAYGMYHHQKDFASHLLVVIMSNLFMYTNFYVLMKLLHRERPRAHSWLFFVAMHASWYTGAYFFFHQSTSWALTPAQSRVYNRMCSLLQLYDSHDVWHLISSVAMFLSFNMYLTIDDNLEATPRTQIMVF